LITEEMVEKYFGEADPIGKSLTIDDKYELKITGVLKNIPGNSHIQFDFVAPY